MDEAHYTKLLDLIEKGTVLMDVNRRYSGAAFGGKAGGFLFTLLFLGSIVGGIIFLFKAMYSYFFASLIGLVLLLIIWSNIAVHYFYKRARQDFDFFRTAYQTGIVRLRVKDSNILVGSPEPWDAIFTAVKLSKEKSPS